jgi:hypothetical protein
MVLFKEEAQLASGGILRGGPVLGGIMRGSLASA